ncbi:hypothetical protein XCCB100_0141 [Xanthomonas campestris pv. campestris]|uniref:Uncharacterized protein n=1 Tax=Xanthomonas campestris pv. campestris (strain B100) TaxID=509169 RepID=B0RLA3_XANCB|nr:hypothetical protein XCCB100_0141 [Xanthomonas campestris pv. campestris]
MAYWFGVAADDTPLPYTLLLITAIREVPGVVLTCFAPEEIASITA